jgi:two-component system, chemotaxis family, CheB/CheR fusion protein
MADVTEPQTDPEPGDDTGARSDLLPVVGIGASAGGLAALRELFHHMPADTGLAFVVVVHLSPDHESHLPDLLQPHASMPVTHVTRTVGMEPNHIYVIPPGCNLTAIDTHLRLDDLEAQRRKRAPIDHFFRTLSETHHETAVGIILTGTGSDGTTGLRMIREKGGLTIVQDPDQAEYDGMPRNAIASGIVDLILPLAEIPQHVLRFARTQPQVPVPEHGDELAQDERQRILKVLAKVRSRTGHDFSRYKAATVTRRIRRRMQMHHVEQLDEYLDVMNREPEEAQHLFDDLLITVTSFFRDRETFEALESEIIPRLFADKVAQDRVRVWSVGCATGEEAYSLAILLLEHAARFDPPLEVQVFATDIHEASLNTARTGLFPDTIEADVTPERLRRFFTRENGHYRIRREVRDVVVFAPHNLMKDPPFSHVDLVACRNVLIYLQRDVQQDIIALFHYALKPHGFLVLGSSETVDRTDIFEPIDRPHCVFRKRNVPVPQPRLPVFPMAATRHSLTERMTQHREGTPSYGSLHQKMVEQYAPPSILVNEDDSIVHFSASAGKYLTHPGGEPTTNVLRLVREPLRIELRAGLFAARERSVPFRSRPVKLEVEGTFASVVVRVQPAAEDDDDLKSFYLVIFDEVDEAARPAGDAAAAPDASVRELEEELEMTRDRLQGIIEEYESSQEEMKAANEELQSTNEELRSTMEELETSKEELQSMNEELATVNQENRHKVEELSQLSSDLQNLLAATDIATLFLDRQLRIMRYTPPLEEIFNIRQSDRGRPISDLTHRLGDSDLEQNAGRVLASLVPLQREFVRDDGCCYLTRISPYRTQDDRIEGVVVTFVDITDRKRFEVQLQETQQNLEIALDAAGMGTWHLEFPSGKATTSARHDLVFGYAEAVPRWSLDIFRDHVIPEDRKKADVAFRRAAETGKLELEVRIRRPDGQVRWLYAAGRAYYDDQGELVRMAGVNMDVTERRETEEALRESEERFRLVVENAHEFAIFMLDTEGRIVSWNPGAERILFYEEKDVLGHDFALIFTEEDREDGAPAHELGKALSEGQAPDMRWHVRKDGSKFWAEGVVVALFDDHRRHRGFAKLMRDETERKLAEEALRASEERYRTLFESMDEGFCVIEVIFQEDGTPIDYRFIETNPAFERHTGLKDPEGKTIRELAPEHEAHWFETYGRIAQTGEANRFEHTAQSLGGRWYDVFAFRIGDAGSRRVAVLFKDITEQKATLKELESLAHTLEQRVEERTQTVQELASTLTMAEQEERRRIARVLHDDLQQLLFGVHLRLDHMATDVAKLDAGRLQSEFGQVREWVGDAIDTTRQLTVDLSPPVLKDEGLGEALGWLASQMREKHGFTVNLDVKKAVRVADEDLRSLFFQATRELLFNAVKHSGQREATVTLSQHNGSIVIEVRDRGAGFRVEEARGRASDKGGFGLFSVRERLRLIGGSLDIESALGEGTRIRIQAPMDQPEN